MPDIIDQNGTWVLQEDADFANLNIDSVDLTDGSWTLIDPNSNVDNVSFSDGVTTIETNAITAGNLNIPHHDDQNMTRWYRPLRDDNGVAMTVSDHFIFTATIQGISSSNPPPFGFGCGLALHPTAIGSDSQTTQGFMGFFFFHKLSSATVGLNNAYVSNIVSGGGAIAQTFTTSSLPTLSLNWQGGPVGGNVRRTHVTIAHSDYNSNLQTRNAITISSSTAPLYLQIGLGARFNTSESLSGAQIKQKIKFKVIKLKK